MLFILGVMTCLLGAVLGCLVVLLLKLDKLTIYATNQRQQEYETAVQTPKVRPSRATIFTPKAKQTETRGRGVQDQSSLVDLSEIDTEAGIRALEDYAEGANGTSR